MPKKSQKYTIDSTQPNLVIVESPAKAKTIKKYLGPGYEVVASMGHIRDLSKKDGIMVDENYQTTYEISSEKKSVVSALKKATKKGDVDVRLATDEDREGEAIARHLCEALGLDVEQTKRIVFREITKDAIQAAVAKPRLVDMDLVNAQQARRVLDRLVGFDLSPVLWRKVKTGLSAGRVQSVAVRLLVEREREIMKHERVSVFKTVGQFLTTSKTTKTSKEGLKADLDHEFDTKDDVTAFLEASRDATYTIAGVQQKPGKRNPSAPFTTSSLQQVASQKLGYSVSRTMQLAQRLYEQGHITYMRTDSRALSKQAMGQIGSYIKSSFGADYHEPRVFASKAKGAQEAHEAIRPTDPSREHAGDDDAQRKLYNLIRKRTIASQMSPAKTMKTTAHIAISTPIGTMDEQYVAKGEIVTFPGFLALYEGLVDDTLLPELQEGDVLDAQTITASQRFLQGPARFTEASLVKQLEELGIGRPSTYAPTITTIQKRGYVEKGVGEGTLTDFEIATLVGKNIDRSVTTKKTGATKGKLVPTDIGIVVTDFLLEHFDQVMDYQFTAHVEEKFDHIADGDQVWYEMIDQFYRPFHSKVEDVIEHAERSSGERILGTDPKTGRQVLVRIGRYGPLVQLGTSDEEDVKYSSLRGDLFMETITLEEALELFKLPRDLGEREGKMIKASIGRFGPYVQRGNTFASLKAPDDPYEVTYERAQVLVEEKRAADLAKILREFVYKDKEGQILKGRRGPYIKRNRKKVKIPKGTDIETLTQDEIDALIVAEVGTKKGTKKPTKKGAKKGTKKTKKKTTAKKK